MMKARLEPCSVQCKEGNCPPWADIRNDIVDKVKRSMLKHWRDGKRSTQLHDAVRGENQTVTLPKYNAAADIAWAELGEKYKV